MAKIIAIEGPDRTGKATQASLLKRNLESLGYKVLIVEVPIQDGVTYPLVYSMLGNGLAKKFPKIFQVLQVLNRRIFQDRLLLDLEHDNDFIIFDRWSLSTSVYGMASGLSSNFVDVLYRQLRKPDFTFVLLGGSHPHEAEDDYEKDGSLQSEVRKMYGEWVCQHLDESHAVDCTRPREAIAEEIMTVMRLMRVLPRKNIVLS
jgi:dTMP kinase